MSTTDSNKLIADFLGWNSKKVNITATRPKGDGAEMYLKEVTEYNNWFIEDELKFHNDWNWLMPVVEKIENLGFEFFIVESRCKIAHNTDKSIEIIFGFELASKKIEAVYYNCVEFVKLYNNQDL
jgi:hypothetical protein